MNRARIAAFGSGLILVCAAPAWAAEAPCPASFAKASGACDERVSSGARACVYPEGKCSCTRSTPCSGVPMPPGEPRWRCQPARTDGCPNDAPAQGGACAVPGKTCSYGDCGSLAYTCDPQKRTWFISGGTAPPPSMPGGKARDARITPRVEDLSRPQDLRLRPAQPGRGAPARRDGAAGLRLHPALPGVAPRAHRLRRPRAGGRTARARVGSAAPPPASRAPRRRAACEGCVSTAAHGGTTGILAAERSYPEAR